MNLNPIRTVPDPQNPGALIVTGHCPFCHNEWTVRNVPATGFADWRTSKHIQAALPTLTPQEREYLLSGICADCWSQL